MQPREPSRTALSAASHRATHQVVEDGRVFADPLAVAILGRDRDVIAADAEAHPERRPMRLFIACRHAFADERVAAVVEQGARQVVILGAGLDTTAYRPEARGLLVFEVDHPATRAWKIEQLKCSSLTTVAETRYVPVDFESESFLDRLSDAGFDPHIPAVFIWLGVVPYLTEDAVMSTLTTIAGLPTAEVIFDYAEPISALADEAARAVHEARAKKVASAGEPWITYFDPDDLHSRLTGLGFDEVEDLGFRAFAQRFLGAPADIADRPGGHLLRASRRH